MRSYLRLPSIKGCAARLSRRWRSTTRLLAPEIKLEAILAAMADAVVVADKSGTLIDLNEAFARLHRFSTKAEYSRALHEYWPIFEVATLEGQPLSSEEWPLAKALRGE